MTGNSTEKVKLLDSIPVRLNVEGMVEKLHLGRRAGQLRCLDDIRELVEVANSIIAPRAIYQVAYVDNRGEATVDIAGIRFTSLVLRANLDKEERVFPYVVTIGKGLEDRVRSFDSLFKQHCLAEMGDEALRLARHYLGDHLKSEYRLGQISAMSPGRLEDWPITQQKQLFSLLGDVDALIGVSLTSSLLMFPRKSVSGICFPTEVEFYSCQLCSRERCDRRQAPYDKDLAERYISKRT